MPESLYRYIWTISGRDQIGLCLLTLLVFPLAMAPLELQRRIVSDAIDGADLRLLLVLCAAYLGVIVVQGGLKYALNLYRGRVSERATLNLREAIYHCVYIAPEGGATQHEDEAVDQGTVVSMLTAEVGKLGGFVGESLSFPLLQGGTMLAVLGYMIWVEPLVAIVAVAIYSPQLVVAPWLQSRINRHAKAGAERVREVGDFIVQHDATTDSEDGMPGEFKRLTAQIFDLRMHINWLKYFLKFFNNLLGHLGPLSVLLVGGWLVIRGQTEVGTIVAFISGFERISDPWRQLVTFYRSVSNARVMYKLVVDTFPPLSHHEVASGRPAAGG